MNENNWVAPPIALILRILQLVVDQQATAMIVVPMWPGCSWSQCLRSLSVDDPIWIPTLHLPRTAPQPPVVLGSLQDIWAHNPTSWSPSARALLNHALASSTWSRYAANLRRFCAYCFTHRHDFPPAKDNAVGAIASFLEAATRTSQQLSSTIASLSAAISTLYETTNFHPTHNPILRQLKRAIIHTRMSRPIKHGTTFNTTVLRELFLRWGSELSLKQLRTKLLAMLCVLGALRVSSAALPKFNQISINVLDDDHEALSIPIVGFKNDLHGEGKTILLHASSNELCCPVRTFREWSNRTRSLRRGVQDCPLLFTLSRPIRPLTPPKCAFLLKRLAADAGLDPSVFTARTFRKSGIMAGIRAGVEPDAIFRLGGWHSSETFFRHYVVQHVPHAFTDIIFDIGNHDDSYN